MFYAFSLSILLLVLVFSLDEEIEILRDNCSRSHSKVANLVFKSASCHARHGVLL